jgi:predicted SnoaL-like aldol condensation-catalyzing enzyme
MIKSSEDRRVQTVLNAFDTLFNKRDYASAEPFWSPRYIQHSAHIPPGREGLFGLVKSFACDVALREPHCGGDR